MNIHEHQAKEILREYGAPVSKGVVIQDLSEFKNKLQKLVSKEFVLKAQIHAGGRGKAGGVKLIKDKKTLEDESKKMMGKKLITPQTGKDGKEVRRLYIEEASEIDKEFYLSCLVDRQTSKIAFISSSEGGMDIEKVADEDPNKIITTRIDIKKEGIDDASINKILSVFNLNNNQTIQGSKIIKILLKILVEKDASLIEINPLILNKKGNLLCLDAKMNFDENALFRRPEILKLRDLHEEEPAEIEAKKYELSYIKLNGNIGCMVNGAGLAMATMDIIKLHGQEPANFLDVGGGATKDKVSAAFKLILSDKNVKGILINIFGGIMRCDVLAQGLVEAAEKSQINIPLVVRLAGTNFKEGKEILKKSNLKILSADNLNDAAAKIVKAIKK
ncbi:MAG: succinate--CoA ligase subunit beta [Pelagibacteraceae bacterium TMED216]|nr:MAG: succinate--CoA ligase subunit beta [Pelagibacteraceae bacterium TMED216]|tara:strand:+ start:698 stop:1864 length:1167 start_codon:yes stop_codon:yes gene_type:complete